MSFFKIITKNYQIISRTRIDLIKTIIFPIFQNDAECGTGISTQSKCSAGAVCKEFHEWEEERTNQGQ